MATDTDRLERYKESLNKRVWDYQDVMRFFNCGKDKAYHIIQLAREKHGGMTDLGENMALADSVLALIKSNRRNERIILRRICNEQ